MERESMVVLGWGSKYLSTIFMEMQELIMGEK